MGERTITCLHTCVCLINIFLKVLKRKHIHIVTTIKVKYKKAKQQLVVINLNLAWVIDKEFLNIYYSTFSQSISVCMREILCFSPNHSFFILYKQQS